jgi:YidC/Oxa1 family membrane protein insertase
MQPSQPNQPSRDPKKKDMSMETRLLIAFGLMTLILFLTPYFYRQPPQPPQKSPAKSATPTEAAKPPAATPTPATARKGRPAEAAELTPTSADKPETFIIDTPLYRVVLSNHGAVAQSWILKKYKDTTGKPVELVNAAMADKVGFPFQVWVQGNADLAGQVNHALYAGKPTADGLGIDYEFSNGKVQARKSFRFRKDRYLADVSSDLRGAGAPVRHLLAWRGGFGDATVYNPASTQHSLYYSAVENKLNVLEVSVAKNGPSPAAGNFSFAGLEDTFFAAVALPTSPSTFELLTIEDKLPTAEGGKEEPRIGAGIGGDSRNEFELFVGPKDLDILRTVNPKLEQLVDWGFFAILAKPLFYALHYVTEEWVHNYGWSIVLVTVAINILLLPLKFSNLKSMKKMQLLQPQIAAINAKYKDIGLRDPKKQQQNQEVMDLYKKHGVNPMGGCFPLLLQLPFFIAFYKVLSVSIEMRGASWLWVTDLSQPETLAIRILPLAMIATQFWMQKMTPTTSMDPSQQRIMLLMPLMLGFMFYSVSSGLVLYWLTGNVVGIIQQWFFNRMSAPAPAPAVPAKPAPKKSR